MCTWNVPLQREETGFYLGGEEGPITQGDRLNAIKAHRRNQLLSNNNKTGTTSSPSATNLVSFTLEPGTSSTNPTSSSNHGTPTYMVSSSVDAG